MIIIGLVLGILAFYSFDLPWIMTQGGPGKSSTILGIAMFKAVFQELRPAYAAAISMVMLVFLFAGSLLTLLLPEAAAVRASERSPPRPPDDRRRGLHAAADRLGVPRLAQARLGDHGRQPLADRHDARALPAESSAAATS